MKLENLSKKYLEATSQFNILEREYLSKLHKLEQEVTQLKGELRQLKYPHWIDFLVKPVAEELIKLLPGHYYEILGPFGICNSTSIHFYKQGITEQNKFEEDNCVGITFIPLDLTHEGSIGIRNYGVDTHEFEKGTVGEVNGMNYPTIRLAPTTKIKDLLQYVK